MTVAAHEAHTNVTPESSPLTIVSCDTHIGPRLVEDLRPYYPKGLLDDVVPVTTRPKDSGHLAFRTFGFWA
jgi:hypothetical protein